MVESYKNPMDALQYEVGRNLLGRNVRHFHFGHGGRHSSYPSGMVGKLGISGFSSYVHMSLPFKLSFIGNPDSVLDFLKRE